MLWSVMCQCVLQGTLSPLHIDMIDCKLVAPAKSWWFSMSVHRERASIHGLLTGSFTMMQEKPIMPCCTWRKEIIPSQSPTRGIRHLHYVIITASWFRNRSPRKKEDSWGQVPLKVFATINHNPRMQHWMDICYPSNRPILRFFLRKIRHF